MSRLSKSVQNAWSRQRMMLCTSLVPDWSRPQTVAIDVQERKIFLTHPNKENPRRMVAITCKSKDVVWRTLCTEPAEQLEKVFPQSGLNKWNCQAEYLVLRKTKKRSPPCLLQGKEDPLIGCGCPSKYYCYQYFNHIAYKSNRLWEAFEALGVDSAAIYAWWTNSYE